MTCFLSHRTLPEGLDGELQPCYYFPKHSLQKHNFPWTYTHAQPQKWTYNSAPLAHAYCFKMSNKWLLFICLWLIVPYYPSRWNFCCLLADKWQIKSKESQPCWIWWESTHCFKWHQNFWVKTLQHQQHNWKRGERDTGADAINHYDSSGPYLL